MASGIAGWLRGVMGRRADAGGGERWLLVDDPDNGYYNFRLMRFAADGDLVRYPDHIWSTATRWGRPGGLREHLGELARRLDGTLYADVLIILSAEDRRRELEHGAASWEEGLQALVERQIGRLCQQQGWRMADPRRGPRLRVIGDGEPAMGGQPLGLQAGEFATALMPNLYHGPGEGSTPFASVYIRVPREAGGAGGFRQVGVFHDDQLAFTVGSHWLDNGRDAELPGPALYTLHRPPGHPEMLHRLNPDLADAYRLRQTAGPQGDTVTVEDGAGGAPVLEVMLIPANVSRPSEAAAGTGGTLVPEGVSVGDGLTLIPEPEPDPRVILSRRALLVQRVHFPRVMGGYQLDIGDDGSVAPQLPEPAARVLVDGEQIELRPLRAGVTVDGEELSADRTFPLTGERDIGLSRGRLTYRSCTHDDPRWPYLGEFSVPAEPHELELGSAFRIGRDRRKCEIALPDRGIHENIHWLPTVDPRGTIPTRGGEVEVASFTTDSIMVAGRHAEIDLRGSEPKVRALSRACPVFVRRRTGARLRLIAKEGATAQPLRQGDELLVGNTLFRVILPIGAVPAPPVNLSPAGAAPAGNPGAGATGAGPGDSSASAAPHRRARTLPHLGPQTDLSLPARKPPPRKCSPVDPDATLMENATSDREDDRYGDLPRFLRKRSDLPRVGTARITLEQGLTVMDSR
ncbi:MAG: FHA domain-containing protein [Myxococcota bacterium]|nr:FHA domain-containing protein [Myxococcota bacterium]